MATPRKGTPRFKRAKARPMRLTERDVAILRGVYEYRLLTSDDIADLVGGSAQNIRRRLQLMYQHGYLDRPDIQRYLAFDERGGPMVYGMGNKGADVLAYEFGIPRPKSDWRAKNRGLKYRFFQHTLMVSSIMVAFEKACREHGRIRFIPWREILETKCPEETKRKRDPMRWDVNVPGLGKVGVRPDAIFGLHYLDKPEGRNRAFFFLEADRGTEPVKLRMKSKTHSSLSRKLLCYQQTLAQKIHEKRFSFRNFRVITVVKKPGDKRVASLIKLAETLPPPKRVFLFGNADTSDCNPLAFEWRNWDHTISILGAPKAEIHTHGLEAERENEQTL